MQTATERTTATPTVDDAVLEELVGRALVDIGAVMQAPLMRIGSRLGLYRALTDEPLTTGEIAHRTGTTERYVREWARSQAAAGFVTYDPATERYSLSAEQALVFADESSPVYLIPGFEQALTIGSVEPRIEEAFRSGDGIGWGDHDPNMSCSCARFFAPGYRAHLISEWIPALDGVRAKLEAGALVADVACGHGVTSRLIAESFPASTVLGFDFHEGSIRAAGEDGRRAGLDGRLSFQRATAKEFPGAGYDLVTMFDCLHDLGDPVGAAVHVREALAHGGTLMVVEPHAADRVEDNLNPRGRAYYSASTLVCTPNSLSQEVGLALGAQAGEAAIRAVAEEAGFTHFRRVAETPFHLVFEIRA